MSSSRVLIVEDNADSRELLCELLRLDGYEVLEAHDGEAALTLLRAGPPVQLVLTDLMMPVMDGWRLRAAMLEDPSLQGVPVVVISAVHGGTLPERCQGVIAKPIQVARLLAYVKRYCGEPHVSMRMTAR